MGLDIEEIGRINEDMWSLLFTPSEIEALQSEKYLPPQTLSTVFFSLKESLFKYQFPIYHLDIDFQEVRIIPLSAHDFRVDIVSPKIPKSVFNSVSLHFILYDKHVISFVKG